MTVSIFVSYFLQASKNAMVPGLELGAMGMAIKRALLGLITANIITWWIGRSYGWKFSWMYQLVNFAGTFFLGWAAKSVAVALISPVSTGLFFSFGVAFFVYIFMVGYMFWSFPWLAGLSREEVLKFLKTLFIKS